MTKAAIVGIARPLLEPHLPEDLDVTWWMSPDEAKAAAAEAEIGWFDMYDKQAMGAAMEAGEKLKWLTTVYAGLDGFPLETLAARGTIITNGVGLNAIPVAEYAVAGMLAMSKRLDAIVRAHDRHGWPDDAPGKRELYEAKVLIVGYGAIGRKIDEMLSGFGAEVTAVRRSPDDDPRVIGPDEWRARLGDFDWVVLAAPATSETRHMIGADELAAMKEGAMLCNIARGTLVDQVALKAALDEGDIAGAFLDTVEPEPLPEDDPLWEAPNCLISMHMSGRSQTRLFERAAERFLENLALYRAGEPMIGVADAERGY